MSQTFLLKRLEGEVDFRHTLILQRCDMNKPYIICYMMSSVDGRIDCAMTEQLKGVEDYYETLA